jgi:hypothetical protein
MKDGVDFDAISCWYYRASIHCACKLTLKICTADRVSVEVYLADFAETRVKSLSDIIAFNRANADLCLSGGSFLPFH